VIRAFAALAVALVACGSPQGGPQQGVSGSRSANQADIAQRATDPRTNDPTATGPAPLPPRPAQANTGTSGRASAGSPTNDPQEPALIGDPAAKKPAATPPKKIGARHVLVQWMGAERAGASVVRSREQALVLAQEVLRRAKGGEDFARLAVEYSDEPGAGGRGGSLGRFGKGQMVPAFEEAVFKLEVGQVSELVETSFGYHVIQRTE
jgi:peptidyl-prolyl cis-trans isomerase NIMA-interacting 1